MHTAGEGCMILLVKPGDELDLGRADCGATEKERDPAGLGGEHWSIQQIFAGPLTCQTPGLADGALSQELYVSKQKRG